MGAGNNLIIDRETVYSIVSSSPTLTTGKTHRHFGTIGYWQEIGCVGIQSV